MSQTSSQHSHQAAEVESELLLEDMGYKSQLQRGLNIIGNLALTLSDITPTASLLVVATAVIATAGTGSLWAYLIGGFIAVNVALCMGELGSRFPVAGGLYSIVTRVLGRPIGFLALLDYIGQAIFLPASVAFGIGTYINALYPSLSTKWIAAGMMIFVALIACLDVRFNAVMIGFFLALEIGVVDIVTWGAILAIFNASLAITLQFARVTYASGRDKAWPMPISNALSYVDPRFKMPWVATMLVGILGAILCAQSSLISVVTFTAVLIIILYALIAISALWSRYTQRDLERPFRMPLWPVPPLIALIGVGLALSQQKGSDLIICAAIFAGGIVYYFASPRPRQDRYWSHLTVPEHELAVAAEAD